MRDRRLPRICRSRVLVVAVVAAAALLPACRSAGSIDDARTVVMIPNYRGGGHTEPPRPAGFTDDPPVTVALGETDPNTMYIHMSRPDATQGPVSFLVTNEGTETHEFVVLQTKTAVGDLPIVSFEGEANRIDEAAKGVVNVGETGDMEPGTSTILTVDMTSDHYAVVCNLPGHYANGMHQDFWATLAAV